MSADGWTKLYRRRQKRTPRQRAAWNRTPRIWLSKSPEQDSDLDVFWLSTKIFGLGAALRSSKAGKGGG